MDLRLRTATQEDVEAICDVYFSAFASEIFSRQAFPVHSGTGREYWRRAYSEELHEDDATFLVATDAASPTSDKIIAYVKWVSPNAPSPEFEDGYPEDGIPLIAAEFYKKLIGGHLRNMSGIRHWYLDMMGVRKESQGKGIAKKLVQWGLDKAEQDQVICFVESTSDSQTFYEKFGFREIDKMSVETPQGTAYNIFMIRDQHLQ